LKVDFNAGLNDSVGYFNVLRQMFLSFHSRKRDAAKNGKVFSDTLYLENKKILVENKAEHCLIFRNNLFFKIWNCFGNVQC